MRIHSLSSFYMQQLYQNSNHTLISEAIFVPISTINKSCNKNKIFSMTYLNSFAECCIRETEARNNVDHLAIKRHSSVLKGSAHAVLTGWVFLQGLPPAETLQVYSTVPFSYRLVWKLGQAINTNYWDIHLGPLSLTAWRNLNLLFPNIWTLAYNNTIQMAFCK